MSRPKAPACARTARPSRSRLTGRVVKRSPAHLLGQIVLFGETSASPDAMHFAAASGISMAWLGYSGKLMARIEGPQSGNVLLRRAQHRRTADPSAALPVACAIVAAKIANQRAVLRRHLRDYAGCTGASRRWMLAQRRLADAARHALAAPDLDVAARPGRRGRTCLLVCLSPI